MKTAPAQPSVLNSQLAARAPAFGFRPSGFLRISGFGFRISRQRGVALIIVMISIFVLTMLALAFAYAMKVETKLAANSNNENEIEWLGRSGVEYARWVLAMSLMNPMQNYDSLDQPWATGSGMLGNTNNPIAQVQNTVQLPVLNGMGSFTWKITDLDRKFNINTATEALLQQAFSHIGMEAGDTGPDGACRQGLVQRVVAERLAPVSQPERWAGREPVPAPLPECCAEGRAIMHASTAIQIRENQARPVKNWPALIRFFQKIAAAGQPSGRKVNGGRLALAGLLIACQLPARRAAMRSASFRDISTEASSNATLARMIHQ